MMKELYIRENERRKGLLKRRDARYVTSLLCLDLPCRAARPLLTQFLEK